MPKISIIMPSLNVVTYIKECMDSVLRQSFHDIEVISVDAGSTDGTLEVLNNYAEQDSRVRIINSNRKSYGYQINMGVAYAKGDYIGIVDTDDEIVSDMYEKLYNVATESGVDYVKGTAKGFFSLPDKERYCYPIQIFDLEDDYSRINVIPRDTPALLTMDNFLWYGLYRSSFFKNIKLHETAGAAFQDMGALFQIQSKAKKAVYIKHVVYYYRLDNMNASTYNTKGFKFIANEYGYAEKFLSRLSPEWHTSFYRKLFHHFMDRMYAMAAAGNFWEDTLLDMQKISKRLKWANETGFLTSKDLPEEQWHDLNLLWKSPRLLYDKYNSLLMEGKEALEGVIQYLKDNSGIIFGSGKRGEFLHAQLLFRGYKNIIAYSDNNTAVQGKRKYGVEIFSLKDTIKNFSRAKYIIANRDYAQEMKKQLLCLGVKERDIWIYSYAIDIRLFGVKLD